MPKLTLNEAYETWRKAKAQAKEALVEKTDAEERLDDAKDKWTKADVAAADAKRQLDDIINAE